MFRKIAIAATAALIGLGGMTQAEIYKPVETTITPASGNSVMPPDGYAAQWWTHPIGCEYSRAGRPGETVWFLIVNTYQPGCPSYIVQVGFDDVY